MHVLIAHNEYGRPSGEEFALRQLETLLRARGHRVSRFTRTSADIGSSPAQLLKAAAAGVHNPFARRAMSETLRTLSPDVVLAQNLYPFLSPSILQACRAHRVPLVMRCCNYRLFCPNGLHLSGGEVCERCLGPGRELWCLLKRCEGSLAKSAGYALRTAAARCGDRIVGAVDMFIVLTEFQKRRFLTNGIPADRMVVIANHREAEPIRPPPGSLVTFIGRVAPEKGIADFVEMARRLPDIPFAVAGELRASARKLVQGAPGNIRWMGPLAPAGLQAVLADTRVLVMCSRWYEGFPNAVLDAMAVGRAVLAANIGGLPEIVDDGRTGLLYPPGDVADAVRKLDELYRAPERCAELGAAGYAKVQTVYNQQRAYEAYMDVFARARTIAEAPAVQLTAEGSPCTIPLG